MTTGMSNTQKYEHPAAGETHLELSKDAGRTWQVMPVHPSSSPNPIPRGYCTLDTNFPHVTAHDPTSVYGFRCYRDASRSRRGATFLWQKLTGTLYLELSTDEGRTWERRPVVGAHVNSDLSDVCVVGVVNTVLARNVGGTTGLVSFAEFDPDADPKLTYVWRKPSTETPVPEVPPCRHTEEDHDQAPALRYNCKHCLRAELSRAYTELRKQMVGTRVVFDREVCDRALNEDPGTRW